MEDKKGKDACAFWFVDGVLVKNACTSLLLVNVLITKVLNKVPLVVVVLHEWFWHQFLVCFLVESEYFFRNIKHLQ